MTRYSDYRSGPTKSRADQHLQCCRDRDALLAGLKDALAFIEDECCGASGTTAEGFATEARALSNRIAAVIKQAEGES